MISSFVSRLLYVYAPGIGVPVLVLWIFSLSDDKWGLGAWVKVLPHLNAVLNGLTAVGLGIAVWHIRHRRVKQHRRMIRMCLTLGALFLVSYLLYHLSSAPTLFGDLNKDGSLSEAERIAVQHTRPIYLSLLLSHTVLASVVIWLVLQALYYAKTQKWSLHKKWTQWAFPIWMYVSISGCVVYALIQAYY